jgi:glycosyltransferase involved in cell wall biosynthesis
VKILAVNWLDLENPQAGGAELHFFEIFKRLVSQGHAVTLIASGWRGAALRTTIQGIDVRRFGGRHSFAVLGRGAVRDALRAQAYDVIVEDINKLPLFLPTFARLPVYVIVPHLFGSTVFREAALPMASVVWLAERPIPLVYRRAAFHAISESTRDDLVARGVPSDRIRVIHPGVDAEWFRPDPAGPRAERPTFLYIGRLKRYKRVEDAIRALGLIRLEFPEAMLQIAGSGDDGPRLRRIAAEAGVAEAVRFLGFVSEEQKLELLRQAWSLIFPSLKEGWGITNVEGAACGTPAIAADSPGLRESVIDGETGWLVRPASPPALAEAMRRVAANSTLIDEFGRRARRFAVGLSWDATAEQTLEHLQASLQTAPSGKESPS